MTASSPISLTDLQSVDVHALSALYEQIPAGPYQAMRCGDGVSNHHEVRQLDTRSDDKHHWPYRLLESVSGQSAGCDDAVFDFVAGVVNAWPLIAELCEEGLIARTLKASGDELRAASRAAGEDPDEAVARLDRIARDVFAEHGLAPDLEGIHTGHCLNITGEITLDRGGVEVRTPLSRDESRFAAAAWNAAMEVKYSVPTAIAEALSKVDAATRYHLCDCWLGSEDPDFVVEARWKAVRVAENALMDSVRVYVGRHAREFEAQVERDRTAAAEAIDGQAALTSSPSAPPDRAGDAPTVEGEALDSEHIDGEFRGFCTTCRRHCNHIGFDGCMNSKCPHGYEPCF